MQIQCNGNPKNFLTRQNSNSKGSWIPFPIILKFNNCGKLQSSGSSHDHKFWGFLNCLKLCKINKITQCSDLKLLKLDDINALQQCNFVYKCVNDQQVPQQLRNFFNFNQNVHEHNTRSSGLLHIPRHRKHLFQHSIRYTGTRHWNNLPKSLKKLSKFKCFSYKVKERLLKCYHL